MRLPRPTPLVLALLLALGLPARAGDVIVHPSLHLKAEDVRDVFLGEKLWHGDVRLVPVENVAAQEAFLASELQTNLRHYNARWRRKSFREGITAPSVKGSDAEVISFVRSTPGAIGYLTGRADASVAVISRF